MPTRVCVVKLRGAVARRAAASAPETGCRTSRFSGPGARVARLPAAERGVRRTKDVTELAAFICTHVFEDSRPVLLVVREGPARRRPMRPLEGEVKRSVVVFD